MSRRRSRRKSPSPQAGEQVAPGKVTVWLSRPGAEKCEHIPCERISDMLSKPGVLFWVDVKDPGPAELEMLREEFKFHRLALEDVSKQMQRPKVDEYPGYFFVVMYAPLPPQPGEEVETVEVDLFVGRNYVVTIHRGYVPALQEAMERWEHTEPDLRGDVGFLMHTVADTVIDGYFPIVDAIEDRLDDIELTLFTAKGTFNAEELLAVKRSLYTLRKAIYPLREVFNVFLRREQGLFNPETLPYFQDVYDHILRLLDIIDIQRDMATGALEAQLSVVSNRLNETMKRLTVAAICVAILGAVFGAWGMNFTRVPLDQLGLLGFLIVCLGALALMGLGLLWAKRRGLW
jgi:magnesium transporter